MSLETVQATVDAVKAAGLLQDRTTVVWHAGEPLAVPIDFYERAIQIFRNSLSTSYRLSHTIQTNGTLLNDAWCRLFKDHDVKIGLSIDGPQRIHDGQRVTRAGKGTFVAAFRGLELLKKHCVRFYVLSVLTAASLKVPNDLFDFYIDNNIDEVGFNVEEIEGVHLRSSLESSESAMDFRTFMSRMYELSSNVRSLRVREFRNLESLILHGDLSPERGTQQLIPYRILSVDCDGNFSTFSPELLGMKGPPLGNFVLGNVHSDSLTKVLDSQYFAALYNEVKKGVEMCRRSCSFFQLCGGGSPSNKISENGTLASTETLQCRLRVKALTDVVLTQLERRFADV